MLHNYRRSVSKAGATAITIALLDIFLCGAQELDPRCPGNDGSPVAGAIFEGLTQTCFLVAGAACDKEQQTLPFPCLPNSVCITKEYSPGVRVDTCTCIEGLTPNADSFCYLDHQWPCQPMQDLCDPYQRLECSAVTGLCDCGAIAYFEAGKCVLRAGEPCGRKSGDQRRLTCGANADCVLPPDGADVDVCVCQGQHVASEDGRCLVPHGRACGMNGVCLPPFVCDVRTFGTCMCPEGTYYNQATDTCFVRANHSCTPADGHHSASELQLRLDCTPNSRCSTRSQKCICEAPLKPTAEGMCYLDHGDDCEGSYECDPAPGLVCKHSICECPYGTHFDVQRGICRVRAGLPCNRDSGQSSIAGDGESMTLPCVLNAGCAQVGGEWQCACVNGTSSNSERLCYARKGEPCNVGTATNCDPVEHLSCEDGECGCAPGMEYVMDPAGSSRRGSCRLLAGSTCLAPTPSCIPDASCVNKTCVCEPGLEGTHCDISFGSNCATDAHKPCASNTVCFGGLCLCPSGYNHVPESMPAPSSASAPQCLPGFHLPCLPANNDLAPVCSPTLVCDHQNEGSDARLCVCAHPHQVYVPIVPPEVVDGPYAICVSLTGAACTLDNDAETEPMYCTPNSDCMAPPSRAGDSGRFGTCECRSNCTVTANQTCAQLPVSGRAPQTLVTWSAAIFAITIIIITVLLVQ